MPHRSCVTASCQNIDIHQGGAPRVCLDRRMVAVESLSRSFHLRSCRHPRTGAWTKAVHVKLVFEAAFDNGKPQLRSCSFGSDEPITGLRPGLRHAIATENGGVRGGRCRK